VKALEKARFPGEIPVRFAGFPDGSLAVVIDQFVLAARNLDGNFPGDVLALIRAGDSVVQTLWRAALDVLKKNPGRAGSLQETPLGAPLPNPPRNIICVGKNYREHVNEIRATALGTDTEPEKPIFFTKAPTAIIGPDQAILSHRELSSRLDYEAEVAVIIGRGGRGITTEDAWDHVFGLTAINDVSARDLQVDHRQWFLGKSLDTSAPMGPTVLHRSSFPAPEQIRLQTRVNGELRQDAFLDQLIFSIPVLIETLSAGMTLVPGDILATGTPAGVGAGFDPPRFLCPGDIIEIEITGIGCLRSPVQ